MCVEEVLNKYVKYLIATVYRLDKLYDKNNVNTM